MVRFVNEFRSGGTPDDRFARVIHAEIMSAVRASYSPEHVGGRVLQLQKVLGYETGREFAAFLGVDENTLTSWTRGNRVPGLDKVLLLKSKTGVTADFIFFGDTATLPVHLFRLLASPQAVNN